MPIGGETIGRAYIRILADGTGFEADAERQMRRATPTFEKEGERHSEAYRRGFQSGMPDPDDEEPLESFFDALTHGRGRSDRIGHLLANGFGEGFEDEVRRIFPDVGNHIIANLRESLASGDIGETGLIDRLHNLRREATRAYQGLAKDHTRAFNEMEQSVKNYADGLDRSGRSRLRFLRDIRALIRVLPDVVTHTDAFRSSVTRMRRDLVSASPHLTKYREEMGRVGTTLGRVFGKGSRNDFLNFVGSFVGGIQRMIRVLGTFYRWPGLIAEQIGLLVAKFVALRDEQGTFGAIFSILGKGAGGLISVITALVATITTVSVALPIFASLIVGTTGVVLALAGSLGFALVGGAAAALGALVPLAVGVGVVALAIGGLDKKNKEVKKNLEQLKDEFKRLQQIAARGLFGKDGAGLDNLTILLKAVEPIVNSVSKALGGLLDELGKAAQTKEFRDLMKELSVILPPMVTTLGHIAGNLGLGLIRAFIVLEPYITNFLGWMEDVSVAFRDFGKDDGARGGSKLAQFMDKASASAMRLWDLIVQVGDVIATVFSAGKSTGDNIITRLADAARELNKWLTSPEGQQALKDMFAFAEQLAGAFGRIVLAVIRFIDALDTPTSRQALLDLLGVIEWIIDKLAVAAGWMNTWLGFTMQMGDAWRNVFSGVEAAVQGAIDAFDRIKAYVQDVLIPDIQDIFGAMTLGDLTTRLVLFFEDAFRGIRMVIDEFFAWWSTAWDFLPWPVEAVVRALVGPWQWLYDVLVGNSIIPDLINEIIRLFATLPILIPIALGNLISIFVTWLSGLPAEAGRIVGLVVTQFSGLAGKLIKASGDINLQFANWVQPLPGIAGKAVRDIIGRFTGLARKCITEAGSFASALAGWLAPGPPAADRTSKSIAAQFSGMARDAIGQAGSLAAAMGSWGQAAVSEANQIANGVVDQFRGLHNDIEAAIGTVHITVVVDMPTNIPRPHVTAIVDVPAVARGGVFSGAQVAMIGEAGPEAVVPLNRPLSQVDPAVRALSAFAQGLDLKPTKDKAPVAAENNVNITVITPAEDPRAVASEVFSRLVAASYI